MPSATRPAVPLDRILVETDSPYLSPQPVRGRPNQPAHLAWTTQSLPGTLGLAPAELATITTANATTPVCTARGRAPLRGVRSSRGICRNRHDCCNPHKRNESRPEIVAGIGIFRLDEVRGLVFNSEWGERPACLRDVAWTYLATQIASSDAFRRPRFMPGVYAHNESG